MDAWVYILTYQHSSGKLVLLVDRLDPESMFFLIWYNCRCYNNKNMFTNLNLQYSKFSE